MTQIGPNFRPNGQPNPIATSRGATSGEPLSTSGEPHTANQPSSAEHHALPTGSLTPALNAELALQPGQLLQLLRNLLKLPKELAQLLAMLANENPTMAKTVLPELLEALLQTETPVPLNELQAALLTHVDEAREKLLKLLQSAGGGSGGHPGQLGELLGTLSELVAQSKQSPGQALHAAIHLYLPYPLHPPQAFSLRQEAAGSGEGGESAGTAGEQLALFIETLTLGQFRITLSSQGRAPLHAIVQHEPIATAFTAAIAQEVVTGLGGAGHIDLSFVLKDNPKAITLRPDSNPPAASAESEAPANAHESPLHAATGKQSVGLHPTGELSMSALYAAYVIIRVIFELDEQHQRHQQRARRIDSQTGDQTAP